MRPETNDFVQIYYRTHTFPRPIVDLGGCETGRQFDSIFPDGCQVWDRRNKTDVDKVIDITQPLPRVIVGSVGTLICVDTLEHIWDYQAAVKNMGMLVMQGGLVIVAMPFAFPFHDRSGDYWRFSHQSLIRLFSDDFSVDDEGYYGDLIDFGQWGKQQTTSYYIGKRK